MRIRIGFYYGMATVMLLLLASCGTKKNVIGGGNGSTDIIVTDDAEQQKKKLAFMQKVSDNAVYSKNIVSKIEFTLKTGDKKISVSGSLHMRKDDVIRIQLTPLGLMEAGRLEFTKDYVMIVDRIHKEYIKADYNQVEFLQRNGLDFYTLQALFWNELFLPGVQKVKDSSLKNYDVELKTSGTETPITYSQGKLLFKWLAETKTGQIKSTVVTYNGGRSGDTSLNCVYSDFKPLGSKQFPSGVTMKVNTTATEKARDAEVAIRMKGVNTDSDWEPRTTVSDKYKQVSADVLIKKLTSL